jgi:uncharacterized membrane protein YhaH (DUF805 family)
MDWYFAALKKYADFGGRARRREYWMFVLINFLIGCGLSVLGMIIGPVAFLSWIYALAMIVPGLAVGFRRLHDVGRSAWWVLIALIPFIGVIVLIVWACQDSQPGDNAWGPNPKTGFPVDAMPAV